MKQKSRMEGEENAGEEIGPSKEDHAKVNPELGAKKKELGMVHGLSCAASIIYALRAPGDALAVLGW